MEYETAYAYKPSGYKDGRASKRSRVEPTGLHSSWSHRRSLYHKEWSQHQARFKSTLLEINHKTTTEIASFVQTADTSSPKIPSGIILTGPSIASHALLFDQLSETTSSVPGHTFLSLTSAAAPNLKTLLKQLIQKGTASDVSAEEDDEVQMTKAGHKGPRLLNYDIQLLYNHVQTKNISRVVVAFQDCEAFDGTVLSDTIELLSCWRDRIPFVFLFGVATSISNFQAKLSRKATRCIRGQRFDVVKAETALEQVFEVLHSKRPTLWIGPGLCTAMLRRQRDHVQSLTALLDSIHYAYLSHFYANALAIFLDKDVPFSQIPKDHFQALRNLESFQTHVERLLDESGSDKDRLDMIHKLLHSDDFLFEYMRTAIETAHDKLSRLTDAVNLFHALQAFFPTLQQTKKSNLLVDGLNGQLYHSTWQRSLMLHVRRSNSETLQNMLTQTLAVTSDDEVQSVCTSILSDLQQLHDGQKAGDAPFRSEEDLKHSTLRTTIVAKKVELSKQKSTLTKGDAEYSSLIRRLDDFLNHYLECSAIEPKQLVFHEIFLYDLRSPHRDVFAPKPRAAIERALAAPHDYLACSCCAPGADGVSEMTLSSSQPITALIYQLYLESGSLINVSDLRSAYMAVTDGDERDEEQKSALFQRALAELKYLGLVRGTRKKADHVLKMSWRGL